MNRKLMAIAIVILSLFFMTSCDGSSSSGTVSVEISAPVQTIVASTSTPTSIPTDVPTVTIVPTETPSSTAIPTETAEPTAIPTNTPEPLSRLHAVAFHDFNGNGEQEEGEPVIQGIEVSSRSEFVCTTDTNGTCTMIVPQGGHFVKINTDGATATGGEAVADLDYMFMGTDVLSPRNGLAVTVVGDDQEFVIALGQGPYPVPVSRLDMYKDFGETWSDGMWHGGVDWLVPGENDPNSSPTIVYANVTGTINTIPNSTADEPFGPCNLVIINPSGTQFVPKLEVYTGHLTKVYVNPGDSVTRGEPIGEIDPRLYAGGKRVACTYPPHLEIAFWGGKMEPDPVRAWKNPIQFSPLKDAYQFAEYNSSQ